MEKHQFIEDLAPGMEVADLFLLSFAQQAQAKNGPYWRLEFRDAGGTIGGKIWSPLSRNYQDLTPGNPVFVRGRVVSYRDKPEISVESIDVLSEAKIARLDLSQFMPASAKPPREMFEELRRLIKDTLSHEPWRRFAAAVLEHPDIGPALLVAPAAKAMHHAYAGGLLEHTLSVCRLCLRLCDHYPCLDRQALLIGALCHDLGKLWELSPGMVADYTTRGRLIGHISLVLGELEPLLRDSGLEPEAADHLRHMILSHHGSREFGSPVLPSTAEAIALHYADNLDAKLNQVQAALDASLGGAAPGWTAYVPALERSLYRAPRPLAAETLLVPDELSNTPETASVADATPACEPTGEPPVAAVACSEATETRESPLASGFLSEPDLSPVPEDLPPFEEDPLPLVEDNPEFSFAPSGEPPSVPDDEPPFAPDPPETPDAPVPTEAAPFGEEPEMPKKGTKKAAAKAMAKPLPLFE